MVRTSLHLALALLLSGGVLPGTSVSASQAPSRTDTARAAKPAPTAKPAKTTRKSGKAKGAKKTAPPCDEPTKQADVKKVPVPVPADPLAPAVAPCPGATP